MQLKQQRNHVLFVWRKNSNNDKNSRRIVGWYGISVMGMCRLIRDFIFMITFYAIVIMDGGYNVVFVGYLFYGVVRCQA